LYGQNILDIFAYELQSIRPTCVHLCHTLFHSQ